MGPEGLKLLQEAYDNNGIQVTVLPEPRTTGWRFLNVNVYGKNAVGEAIKPLLAAGLAEDNDRDASESSYLPLNPDLPRLKWTRVKASDVGIRVTLEDLHNDTSK